jgi:hypothetical protein
LAPRFDLANQSFGAIHLVHFLVSRREANLLVA